VLEQKLGEGAMGTVWLARHATLGSAVAIKLIRREALARNQRALGRFEREAVTAARIKSSHVVKVIDHGYHEGLPFMVMEHLEGESLRTRLGTRGRLSLHETALIVRHVARALTQAHALGLVHRDIKPENIFITPSEDENEVIKVLDFGIAKVTDELIGHRDHTQTGAFLGTPHYMSPEQAYGLKTVGPKSDLWSLGVMTFECITGSRPFRAPALAPLIAMVTKGPIPAPSQLAPGIPREVDAWMARALERDENGRFESAREMAEAFATAAGVALTTSLSPSHDRPPAPQPMGLDQTVLIPDPYQATVALPMEEASRTGPLPDMLPIHAHPTNAQPMHVQPVYAPQPVHAQHIETADPVSHTVSGSHYRTAHIPKTSWVVPVLAMGGTVLVLVAGVGLWLARSSAETETAPSAPSASVAEAEPEPKPEPKVSTSAEPPPPPPAASSTPVAPSPRRAPKPPPPPAAPEPWKHRRTL